MYERENTLISETVLEKIASHAVRHDNENTFPHDDFELLSENGYFKALVPLEFGGQGATISEVARAQTELAMAAPATALAINMHQIIVALGRHLVRSGRNEGEQILRGAVAGEIYGFGISEPGNDLVLFGSITDAKPADKGGYRFSGTKIFTSMGPAWTKLLTFGRDSSNRDNIHNVFAIIDRDPEHIEIKEDWDTLGMRATQSFTTVLNEAYARPDQILGHVPSGPSGDPVVFGIFAYFELLLAATYSGIGLRAIEVAVDTVKRRNSVKNNSAYATDPDIRWRIANGAIVMNSVLAELRDVAGDLEAGVNRGAKWMPQLSALKNHATEAARIAVDEAIRSAGGSSYYNTNELARLYRDVLAGIFQPSDQESLHAAWAHMLLD
ncbi:MAG: acyl-CoA dehydrogenase family protein [Varibaculum sp.]|nr:acyl-CoA dehydrogenase family protein [Varibaculum sp.]